MLIKTNEPIAGVEKTILREIEEFWDKISLGWQNLWGSHIHHGYYEQSNSLTPIEAQEKLLEKLSELVGIQSGDKILDVGCGLGGSSRYLAEHFNANIDAITLSKVQMDIAKHKTGDHLASHIHYSLEDAHNLKNFLPRSFDIVWSLESCEQFYNKMKFIQESERVLKSNGKLMIATWCADQDHYSGELAKNYYTLCKQFQLPYMPTFDYYQDILSQKFNRIFVYDWSSYIKPSWEIGINFLKDVSWLKLYKLGGLTGLKFIRNLKLMQNAFNSGQLRYGVFLAMDRKE